MITILRKVRQSLLESGRTGRYLIYAIGEILLVVVGILIALQINNLNELRQKRQTEIKFLSELKNDLETNLEEIQYLLGRFKGRVAGIDTVMNYINNQSEVDSVFVRNIFRLSGGNIFNNANTSYKFLETNGINFLSNDSLRLRITNMYEQDFKNIHYREDMELRLMKDHLEPLMRKKFRPGTILSRFGRGPTPRPAIPIDIQKLKSDHEFQNTMYSLKGVRINRIIRITDTIDLLEVLIQDIETEIKRLKN